MLAAEHYPYLHPDFVMPNHELFETHSSKISLTRAKKGYAYPVTRLPYTFSKLAGLPTQIYQTMHNGALAFLVVVSSSNKNEEENQKKSENLATDSRYSYLHGEGRAFESPLAHRFFFQSDAKMKAEVHEDWDEKLCNFGVAETDESLARIMTDRYIDDLGDVYRSRFVCHNRSLSCIILSEEDYAFSAE